MHIVKTPRLLLRQWQQTDLEPFACMNRDPRVREFFPSLQTREESDLTVNTYFAPHIEKHGWGLWAVERNDTQEFIGFIGMQHVPFEAAFTPAVEIGWRLAFAHWGMGYATEGAKATLEFAFKTLQLPEVVAITTVQNVRSRHVMEKIGMHHNTADDFNHPKLQIDHPLCRHVLYRISGN